MRALIYDGRAVRLRGDHPSPQAPAGWAVLRVLVAGICRTDLELVRGYREFRGVLGHELVAEVAAAAEPSWLGRRVVAEINVGCGVCDTCRHGLGRHCAARRVLGIDGLDGAMAELCALPLANLHPVPTAITDERAVFAEPLAAAYEVLEQVPVAAGERCLVLGDGKLGILCAWVLAGAGAAVTLVGRHPAKLERARWGGITTLLEGGSLPAGVDRVVEATGTVQGLERALERCRPCGTVVLKSTVAAAGTVDLTPLVVKEIRLVGSRCGPLARALAGLVSPAFPVERLIDARYPLAEAEAAFEHAARRGVLKVLLQSDRSPV